MNIRLSQNDIGCDENAFSQQEIIERPFINYL